MTAQNLLKQKQIFWALRHDRELIPATKKSDRDPQDSRGEKAYTKTLDLNLFEPLSGQAKGFFEKGDGAELKQKMRAVHSSSALGVNFFHYWYQRNLLADLAKALEVPSPNIASAEFECKRPVMANINRDVFPHDPNLDFVIKYSKGETFETAIECKFTEPLGRRSDSGRMDKYLSRDDLWVNIPLLRKLGQELNDNKGRFLHLHAAQLIKHILGLLHALRTDAPNRKARLVYLYYGVAGNEGCKHHSEIEEFKSLMAEQFPTKSPIMFQTMTYQDALVRLAQNHRDHHTQYLDWMLERYL